MAALDERPTPTEFMSRRPGPHSENQYPKYQDTVSASSPESGSAARKQTTSRARPAEWDASKQQRRARRNGSREAHVQDDQIDTKPMPPPYEPDYERAAITRTASPRTNPRAAPSPAPPRMPHSSPRTSQDPSSASSLTNIPKPLHSPPLTGSSWDSRVSASSTPGHRDRASGHSEPTITAFPGTMSARERSPARPVPRSASVPADISTDVKKDTSSLGKRFRSALKDMFKREPVDASNLERITDRHWTEDEY